MIHHMLANRGVTPESWIERCPPKPNASGSNSLNRVQAVIEFDLQGNILTANDNFLHIMG